MDYGSAILAGLLIDKLQSVMNVDAFDHESFKSVPSLPSASEVDGGAE